MSDSEISVNIIVNTDGTDASAQRAATAIQNAANSMQAALASLGTTSAAAADQVKRSMQTVAQSARAAAADVTAASVSVGRAQQAITTSSQNAAAASIQAATAAQAASQITAAAASQDAASAASVATSARMAALVRIATEAEAARAIRAIRTSAARDEAEALAKTLRAAEAASAKKIALAATTAEAVASAIRQETVARQEAGAMAKNQMRVPVGYGQQHSMPGSLPSRPFESQADRAGVQMVEAEASGLQKVKKAAGEATEALESHKIAAAGVTREAAVLGRELVTHNWSRFSGSLLVMAQRLNLLQAIFSPLGAAIIGVTAIMGVFVGATLEGYFKLRDLQAELILTGNAAGLNADKFHDLAEAIKQSQGGSILGAQASVMAAASGGEFSPAAFEHMAALINQISQLSGRSADKVAEDFKNMGADVFKWATTSKDALNTVTYAEAEHARQLQETGHAEEAEIYIADTIMGRLRSMSGELNRTTDFWDKLKGAAASAWNAMENFGSYTVNDKIKNLEDEKRSITDRSKAQGGSVGPGSAASEYMKGLDAQIAKLQTQKKAQEDVAEAQGKQAEKIRESKTLGVYFDETLKKTHGAVAAQTLLNQALAEYNGKIAEAKRFGLPIPSAAEQAEYRKTLMEQHKGGAGAAETPSAAMAVDRADTQGALAITKDKLRFQEEQLERSYKNGKVSLEQYYQERLRITTAGVDAEIAVVRRELQSSEQAQKLAKNPNQQAEAQAGSVRISNQLVLLEQQRAEAVQKVTDVYSDQIKEQQKEASEVQSINQKSAATIANLQLKNQQATTSAMLKMKLITDKQALQADVDYENQRFQLALASLNKRMELEGTETKKLAELNATKLQLEQEHQNKLDELSLQGAEQDSKNNEQATTAIEGSFNKLFSSLAEHQTTVKNSLLSFVNDLQAAITKIMAQILVQNFLSTGTPGGGAIQSLLGTIGLGGAGGSGASSGLGAAQGIGGLLAPILSKFGLGAAGGSGFSAAAPGVGGEFFNAGAGSDLSSFAAYAQGTNYVPETQLALLHKGEAVVPARYNNNSGPSTGVTVVNNFTLTQAQDLRTQSQVAAMAGAGINRALRRNG